MHVTGDRSGLASNVLRYGIFRALGGVQFGLIIAIWVIYLQRQYGLNLTQVTLIDVAFWVAATLGEVPTGVVADTISRKASLVVGAVVMSASILVWAFAPSLPLIVVSYMLLALGATFLSGAEEAFFYESLQGLGRAGDYTRLAGRIAALRMGAAAVGNVASGWLASLDLRLPFLVAGLVLLVMFGVALTFREPAAQAHVDSTARLSYGEILRQSFALTRAHPVLRYAMAYLAFVPMAAVIVETVFLQPQAVALGVPLAGVGVVVMMAQVSNMAGSTWAYGIKARLGEPRMMIAGPVVIIICLVMLAAFQHFLSLTFVALIGFATAALRPVVLNRMQHEVPDAVRATVLSMQSLVYTVFVAICEPLLGLLADRSGLPAAYGAMAGGLGLLILLLVWKSRDHVLWKENP